MNLLHIDSSILGDGSASRALSAQIVAHLTQRAPDTAVTYRDLAARPLPHLSGALLAAPRGDIVEHPEPLASDLAISAEVLGEFLAADTIVIGVAFYNFTIATQLKAWIDRILLSGVTFRYGADGRPEGMMGAKRVILGVARGGIYGAGGPLAALEHGESYLRSAFGFIGITQLEAIVAEGVGIGPDQRAAALNAAGEAIRSLAA